MKTGKKIELGVVLGSNVGQIKSNVVKKVKKQAISLGFIHILLGEYLLKQKVVVAKSPEWKFMAIKLETPNLKDVRAKFLLNLSQKW